MKTFFAAFLGATLGTSLVLVACVFLLDAQAGDAAKDGASVARPSVGPQHLPDLLGAAGKGVESSHELIIRLESDSPRLRGDLRSALGPKEPVEPVLERGSQSSLASGIELETEPPAPAEKNNPFLSGRADPGTEWTFGPLATSVASDGSLLYRGEQMEDANGDWIRHGNWNSWYPNGQREEDGRYRDGVEHGPWEWWYEDGRRMAEGTFARGNRVGRWTFWHEGGELMMTGQYDVDGNATDTWAYYHENGMKRAEGEMIDDKPEGRWTSWDEDGSVSLERSGLYVRGERVGR